MIDRVPPADDSTAPTPKPVLGERRDLQGLLALHEELVRHQGGVVVLEGPRGVGKAALLGQLRRELAAKGRLVLFGRAEQTATSPYACLREPAAQALAFLESRGLAETFLDTHAAALGLLLPNLAQTAPMRTQDKTGFFEALRAFFLDLAGVTTPTLLLADVHYADDDTRDLIRFLAAHLYNPEGPGGDPAEGFNGVLMLACRTDDDDGARVVLELSGGERFRRFTVSGLNKTELLGYLADHPALERLLAASGGRPEDIDELLDSLPPDTDSLLLDRVASLAPNAQACLKALAVVGGPVPPDLLAAVLERPVAEVAQALSSLVEKRLLARRLSNGELLFTFARAHHNEVLRNRLPVQERKRLHQAIGQTLEERATDAGDQLLAFHFLEGSEPSRGVPYALLASERLLVTFAYGSAAQLIRRALPHTGSDEQRFSLLSQLVEAEHARGQLAKALDAAQQMRALASPAQLPTVLRKVGELLAGRGEHKAALEMLEQALGQLEEPGAAAPNGTDDVLPERAQVLAAISDVAYRKGDLEEAERRADEALLAAPRAPVAFRINVANTLARVSYSRERYEEAEQRFLENLALADKHELDPEAMRARVNAGLARFHLGRYEEAREILERALGQARAAGDVSYEAQALLNLGATSQRESDLGRAIRYFQGALALYLRMGKRLQLRLTTWNLANVYVAVGMHEKARTYLDQSRRIAELDDSDRGRAFVHFSEGDIAYDQAQFGQALASYENARSLFRKIGDGARVVEMTVKSAWAALELGDLDAAVQRMEELPEHGEALTLPSARQRALRGAIRAAAAEEEGTDAGPGTALLSRAIDELDRLHADEDAWRALVFLAARYEAQGDRKSAEACRQRARAIIGRLGEKLPKDLYKSFLEVVARELFPSEERDARTEEPSAPAEHSAPPEPLYEHERARASPIAVPSPSARKPEWDQRYKELVGRAPQILRVFDRLDRIARTSQATVLIRGESGTGKELVAAAVHRMSDRKAGPFVRVNCAALVETLLMSELFGHEKGSFTGAFARKVGRFELARGGTIFLDEIGDISPKTQVSLLRVLQEKSFERVGGTQTIHTDAAVICATHRDFEAMVQDGSFREDLYYRLRGVVVEIPALRDRPDDIPMLARHFLEIAGRELGRAPTSLSREADDVLVRYRWPGNIRELQNVVRSVALFCEGDVVGTEHLAEFPELFEERRAPAQAAAPRRPATSPEPAPSAPPASAAPYSAPPDPPYAPSGGPASARNGGPAPTSAHDVLRRVEREAAAEPLALGDLKRKLEFEAIANAMRQTAGNITQAAKLLKMKRPRLSQIVNGNPELKAIKEASRVDGSIVE